ncbi:MAG TPA: FHA domain-containing protein [Myxococcales bacterium]|jgi:pSer/pThr/pTyr-binding forkhead associated (FHA) protein
MSTKKPDDSGVVGQGPGPGPTSPAAKPGPDDETTTVGEVERPTDLDTTVPLQQLKESDLTDSQPGAPDLPFTEVAPRELDDTQEVRLEASAAPKPRDTEVSPPPVRRPSQTAVPAAAAEPADTAVSPAPVRRPVESAEKPADTTVSTPPAAPRRASQTAVPAVPAPEKPAPDTTVSPAPARRASQLAVPVTAPSAEKPAPTVHGVDDTREVQADPPAVAPRRASQTAVPAAAHAGSKLHGALALEHMETRDVQLPPAAAPRRPSKTELPATNPVAAPAPAGQDETREVQVGDPLSNATTRPGTSVVPWKPSVPAPSAQAPASVIVHVSATELQKVEPPPKHAAPLVVLEVVGGHDIGRKVAMKGPRLTVGREAPCDLLLADAAVARLHLELVDGPDGLELHDLSNGAGTRVNGREVSKTLLRPGDRIGLGRAVVVVRRGPERMSTARRALEATRPILNALRPKSLPAVTQGLRRQLPPGRWGNVAVGSIGLAVVILLVALFLSSRRAGQEEAPSAPRVGDSVLVLGDAEKLFDAKQYDAALRRGHEAQRLADGPEVRRFVARCREAIQVKRQIDSAQDAAARGQYDLAIAKGKAIKASGTTGARLESLLKSWTTAREDAIVQNVRMQAKDGDFATARALIIRSPAPMQGTLLREVDELEAKALVGTAGRQP